MVTAVRLSDNRLNYICFNNYKLNYILFNGYKLNACLSFNKYCTVNVSKKATFKLLHAFFTDTK